MDEESKGSEDGRISMGNYEERKGERERDVGKRDRDGEWNQ